MGKRKPKLCRMSHFEITADNSKGNSSKYKKTANRRVIIVLFNMSKHVQM